MVKYQTLFERLGVLPDAEDEAIHAAFTSWFAQCGGDELAIPQDVREAYKFLSVPTNRQHYRDLLEACESGDPIEFAPDQGASLERLCQLTEIVLYPDRHRQNTFHFRRPDQSAPGWLQPPIEPQQVMRKAPSFLWQILTLRPFRGASPRRKLCLAVAYVLGAMAVVGGLEWAVKGRDNSQFAAFAVGPSPAAVEQARRRTLEKSILAKHQEASSILKSLDEMTARLRSDFKQVIGLEWEQADNSGVPKPRALDLALIREESVREAWTDLIASRIPAPEIDSRRQVVESVGQAAASGNFRAEDEVFLAKIIEWGQSRVHIMQSQPLNLEHIQVMLAAEEFRLAGDKTERSSP